MVDTTHLTRRAALGLIAGGAIVSGANTMGFGTTRANRTTSVGSADDPEALLGIEGSGDESVTPAFTNRSSYLMAVTLTSPNPGAEFDVGSTSGWESSPVSFEFDPGERVEVAMRGGETVTADVDATLLENGATRATIELRRTFPVPQAGQVSVTPGVSSGGGRGRYQFELENDGDIDVTVVGLGINETTNEAVYTVGHGDILTQDGTQLVDVPIPIDSTDPGSDTRRDFLTDVGLPVGSLRSFEFDRFQRDGQGSPHADMRGHDVRVTLYFEDASSITVLLEHE